MARFYFLSFLIFLTSHGFSQEILNEKEIHLKSGLDERREAYTVVNEENGQIVIFLFDSKNIYVEVYDKDYHSVDNFTYESPYIFIGNLLGHNFNGKEISLFISKDDRSEFIGLTVDISKKEIQDVLIPISFFKERFLESFSYKNKFYLLSVQKKSSLLNMYVFDSKTEFQKKELDLRDYSFTPQKKSRLSDALFKNQILPAYYFFLIQKINPDLPNPMELASKPNKLYCNEDYLTLTFDNDTSKTTVININLNDFNFEGKYFTYQSINNCQKSNSFLYKNKLYQIKASKQELYFKATDIASNEAINQYRIERDKPIQFKEYVLVQEEDETEDTENETLELETSNKLLSKISKSDVGMSVYEINGKLEISLGGSRIRSFGSFSNGINTFPGVNKTYIKRILPGGIYTYVPDNESSTNYGGLSFTRYSTNYIKSLFDTQTVTPINEQASPNAYDKIIAFTKSDLGKGLPEIQIQTIGTAKVSLAEITAETIFRVNDYFVYGYYDKSEKKYYLRKFTDD